MVNPNHYQLEIEKLFVQWKKKKKEDSHINHRDGVFIRETYLPKTLKYCIDNNIMVLP